MGRTKNTQNIKPKKDYIHMNFNIEREIAERLSLEAEKNGQTMTKCLERLLGEQFDRIDKKNKRA